MRGSYNDRIRCSQGAAGSQLAIRRHWDLGSRGNPRWRGGTRIKEVFFLFGFERHPRGWRRAAGGAAGAVILATLAACGASPSSNASTPSVLTISLGAASNLNWWPPIVSSTDCGTLTGGGISGPDMYMPLLWFSRTDQIEYSRSIASGIAVSRNDTQYTITMNPKWHWSNGQPVTAQDVAYDWTLINGASASNSPFPYCFAGSGGVPADFQSVVATGAHTVVVTLNKSVNPVWFEHNGLSQLIPVPKSTWDQHSNIQKELAFIKSVANSPNNPIYRVVDGPYRIEKAVTNQYYTFVANPKYSGAHPAQIKTVTYLYETSTSAQFAQLRTHKVDLGYLPFSLYGSRNQLTGYNLIARTGFAFFYLPLNYRTNAYGIGGLFNNLYVRQALQMGIDQPAIIKSMYHGYALPSIGPVPVKPPNAYYDPALKNPYPYNPTAGKKLLEHNGWRLVNGVMTKGSQKLAFNLLYSTGSATFDNMAQLMKQDWAQEGVDVSLQPIGGQAFGDIIGSASQSNKWAMAGGFGWIYVPDFYPSGGSLFLPTAGFNLGAYNSATMNRLIAATYAGGTKSQVTQRFNAYQVYAAQNLPGLFVPTPDSLSEVRTIVKGFRSNYNPILGYTPVNRLSFSS